MKIEGLKIHRKLSWVLAFFSFAVVIVVALRRFLEIYDFYSFLHLGVEWILMGIVILVRIFRGLKNKRARPIYILRLIQLITNRAIIILAALVVLSGLGYYEWYDDSIGIIIPFESHIYYDFFLSTCIIVHVAVGFKFMFMRRKIKHSVSNVFVILLSSFLIVTLIYLTFIV
jgi:hypothetical protein